MRDIRICFFGDSFVNGVGDLAYLGWTGRVCKAMISSRYALTHYNLGIRGNSSQQIEARWQAEAALRFTTACDARVVFSFGTNDNLTEDREFAQAGDRFLVEPRNSLACARRILTQAIAQYPTLLIGPPPIADAVSNQRNAASSKAYKALAAALGVPYLDTYQPLRKNNIWMEEVAKIDGAHPAASGYAALADLVLKWPAWQAWFTEI